MRIIKYALLIALVSVFVLACATEPAGTAQASAPAETEESGPREPEVGMLGSEAEGLEPTTFVYMHVEGSGAQEPILGHILFENETLDYVQYQVGYTSCLCRPQHENVRSLMYVEITPQGTINNIRFDYWGESEPIPWTGGYGHEEFRADFIEPAVGMSNEDIQQLDNVSGATVTVANYKTMLDGLMTYHENNYM